MLPLPSVPLQVHCLPASTLALLTLLPFTFGHELQPRASLRGAILSIMANTSWSMLPDEIWARIVCQVLCIIACVANSKLYAETCVLAGPPSTSRQLRGRPRRVPRAPADPRRADVHLRTAQAGSQPELLF